MGEPVPGVSLTATTKIDTNMCYDPKDYEVYCKHKQYNPYSLLVKPDIRSGVKPDRCHPETPCEIG